MFKGSRLLYPMARHSGYSLWLPDTIVVPYCRPGLLAATARPPAIRAGRVGIAVRPRHTIWRVALQGVRPGASAAWRQGVATVGGIGVHLASRGRRLWRAGAVPVWQGRHLWHRRQAPVE